jgi:hypothetical protein
MVNQVVFEPVMIKSLKKNLAIRVFPVKSFDHLWQNCLL